MFGSSPEHLLISQSAESIRDTLPPSNGPEWLDANRWVVFAILAATPFLVTLPLWIFGLSPDPIWFFSGIVQNVRPGPISGGLPFLDPNVGFTTQALGHLAASQWAHGRVPWWNPYSGIGVPLAGEMQPGAFFLPFIFLLLLHHGLLWLKIAMQLVAGFSTFFLLREMGLGRLAALLGGLLFELNGTFAWTPGPTAVFCAAAFLPLVLLGVEQISNRKRARSGTLWVALGIAFSLLAGFPEPAYIDGLLILLWSICRFATVQRRWHFALRVAWGAVLGLLLAGPLLTGFWSLLQESSVLRHHEMGHGTLPVAAFPTIFLPYAYGAFPAAHGSATLQAIWGSIGGYAGILLFFFALLGLQAQRPRWLRVLLFAWVLVAWAKTFGLEPVTGLMNHIPFLLQTAFYRYANSSWELCLIILAAFAIEESRHRTLRIGPAIICAFAVLVTAIYIALPTHSAWGWDHAQRAKIAKYIALSAGWALSGLTCACIVLFGARWEKWRWALAGILALDAAALFLVPLLSAAHPGKVDLAAIRFLRQHLSLSRFYTLNPLQPNYGAYFRLASINYNCVPAPPSIIVDHISNRLFPPLPKSEGTIFWPAWAPYGADAGLLFLRKFLPNYEALGVRYVIANAGDAGAFLPQVTLPTAETNNIALALQPDQHVEFSVPAPASPEQSSGSIAALDLFIGTYANTSDGALAVKICADEQCAQGNRPLSESSDNSFFSISLSPALRPAAGDKLRITVTHEGGFRPVALWLWPDLPGQDQDLLGPEGKLVPGKAMRVAFTYGSHSAGLPRVYHDSLINIFELPHPAPLYSIASGGPCRLDSRTRDSLHAACTAPAVLVRRGLYMPGWHASRGSKRLEARPYDKIFQSYDLPAGDSRLQFAYVPPHALIATCGSLFAAAALLVEFMFDLRRRLRVCSRRTSDA